jgi:hypothetical protein
MIDRCGVNSSTAISSTANSSNANSSTAQLIDSVDEFARCQCIDRHFHRQPTGALVAPDYSLLDPTVWLDGARPANTCIPPSFP